MDAIMQALMGGDALTDDDKMQQVANQLRQSDNAAQIFSMSTIAPIANAAKKQRGIIQDAALRGGRARQLGLERARERQLEKDRLAREATERKAKISREDAIRTAKQQREDKIRLQEHGWDTDKAANDRQNKLDVQALKEDEVSNLPDFKPKDIENFSSFMENTSQFLDMVDDALAIDDGKPRFELSTGFGATPEDKIDRFLARNMPKMIGEKTRASINWWNNYERFYNAVKRKELFGSQFTPSEQEQWESMSIQRGDPEDVIRLRLNQQREFLKEAAQRRMRDARMRKVTEDQVRSYVGGRYDQLNSPIMVYSSNKNVKPYRKYGDKKEKKTAPRLEKSVAAINGPNTNAVVTETPEGRQAVVAPDKIAPPEKALSEIGMDARTLGSLAETDPDKFRQILTKYPALVDLY